MSKPARPSLADFNQAQQPAPAPTAGLATVKPKTGGANVKEELIQTSFRLPRARWEKLQQLSIHERASVQSLLVEALELVFDKKGLKF